MLAPRGLLLGAEEELLSEARVEMEEDNGVVLTQCLHVQCLDLVIATVQAS